LPVLQRALLAPAAGALAAAARDAGGVFQVRQGMAQPIHREVEPREWSAELMKPLVLYHANCLDGFCAAWVARKAMGEIEAIPVQYGQEPPDVTDRQVLILDFSYKRSVMRKILSQAMSVVVLDHHKTAEAELAGIVDEFIQRPDLIANRPGSAVPVVHFDMDKSGGRLTWEYFAVGQSSLANCPVPWLVEYTEDRDLWLWKEPHSRAVNAWLRSYPLDFAIWDKLFVSSPLAFDGKNFPVGEGEAILRRERQIIDDHLRNAREIEMDGHKVLAVNATVLFSDIAGELAKDRPFGTCYFDRQDGKRQWSLRSRDDGVDVSAIAKAHGGGGHRNAAGFEE
jgi:hypothetical protein